MNDISSSGVPSRDPAETTVKSDTSELEKLRARIDEIDSRLIALLAERRKIVDAMVSVKRGLGLPVYHPARNPRPRPRPG